MFNTDIRRIKACIDYKDYFSALEYALLVKDNYTDKNKHYFEDIIKYVKEGSYEKIINILYAEEV